MPTVARRLHRALPLDDKTIVRALKALSDAKRFRMVQELASAGELHCGGLAEKFDLSQPTMSHHLKILIDAGILQSRSDAQHHFLSVNHAFLDQICQLIPHRFEKTIRRPLARKSK